VQDGDVAQLDAHAARELEPALTSEVYAALLVNGDASVDNRKLGASVERAAHIANVEFRTGVAVRKIVNTSSAFQHVELQDHSKVHGAAVVIAAGAWSSELTGLPIKIPTLPVRGQMLALEHENTLLHRMIVTMECYLVPRAGRRVLVGATVERVGFDVRTTPSGINGLLDAARRVVPEFGEANLVETWAGLRPGTPDDLPILGADPHISGVYYATGHFRNGILLSPVTAELMAELIADGKTSYDVLPFSIGRFVVDVRDPICDLCGTPMREFHCRITCPSCGYQRDCSDP
jgi:glycine oxidase